MANVEVVYKPIGDPVVHLCITTKENATVGDSLQQSGLLQQYPEARDLPVGIFGQLVSLNTVVQSGDRLEVYRPLVMDPKEKRRQRARHKKER